MIWRRRYTLYLYGSEARSVTSTWGMKESEANECNTHHKRRGSLPTLLLLLFFLRSACGVSALLGLFSFPLRVRSAGLLGALAR